MENITSVSNSKIIKYSKLNQKKYRDEYRLFLLENFKLIEEAIIRGEEIEDIIVLDSMYEKYISVPSISSLDNLIVVPSAVFSKISDTVSSQGIIAVCKIKEQINPSEIHGKVLVLDRIQDAGNLGTLMRSSIGFGFNTIALINSVDPYNPKCVRSCGGSIFSLNLLKIEEKDLIFHAKSNNFAVFVADMEGENLYEIRSFPENTMVVIGNEGQGVSDNLSLVSTHTISIPMSGKLESLNAGVSGSIIMSYIFATK